MKDGYNAFFKAAKKTAEKNNRGEAQVPVNNAMKSQMKVQNRRPATPGPQKKRKAKVSMAVPGLMAALVLSGGVLWYLDDIDQLLAGYEVGFLSGASAASEPVKEEKTSASEVGNQEKLTHPDAKEKVADAKAIPDESEKDTSFFNKLNERKNELDRKEKDLAEVERELQEQRKVLDEKIIELNRIRSEISKVLKDRIEMDSTKVDKLVEFYSNMKPQQAAQVFAEINEELAVEVLGRMKKSNAASIMNLLKADKAQALSEKFAGYRQQQK